MVKNPPASAGNTGDAGSVSGPGTSPGAGNGNPLPYSCLNSAMDNAAWQDTSVHGIAQNQTELSMHTCD